MEQLVKTPDQKMRAGAITGIVISIITAVWAVVMVIIAFAWTSVLIKNVPDQAKNITFDYVTAVKIGIIVGAVISITVSGIIIWLCRNVLNGTAKNGLAAGITLLVLSALGLIGFISVISAVSVFNLLISIAGIVAGILLVIGKYETQQNKEIVVESVNTDGEDNKKI